MTAAKLNEMIQYTSCSIMVMHWSLPNVKLSPNGEMQIIRPYIPRDRNILSDDKNFQE